MRRRNSGGYGGWDLGIVDSSSLESGWVSTKPGALQEDTGPLVGRVDVSAFAGTGVRIGFNWVVPESFTGPAFFQLDRVEVIGCGDGIVQAAEQCDDGNTGDGDCCSSTCQLEPAAECATP
jgi:cysteine-rich repeat protein